MPEAEGLRDRVPENCKNLLDLSANELRSAIPELARDQSKMSEVEQVVQSLPSHHDVHLHDARDLSMIDDGSIQLMVTSPPYFNIKDYENGANVEGQLGDIGEYQTFNDMLDKVWSEVYDKLVPGGRMVVIVGDVLLSRSEHGRHRVLPLHATIQERSTEIGFDNLAPLSGTKSGMLRLRLEGMLGS